VAILNGTGGLVEAINLRTTVLRGLDGALHIFPNGGINTLSNLTHNFSFYLFDIGVAYKEDVDRVIEILKKLSDEVMVDPTYGPEILEPLEILGLDKFADSAIIIKARIKTKPIKQWMVGREMNRRIKKRFDEEGIEIPFPHSTIYFGEASPPFDVRIEESKASEAVVKKWVKEVLDTHQNKTGDE
jgi:small conductance mechanosensitive channel